MDEETTYDIDITMPFFWGGNDTEATDTGKNVNIALSIFDLITLGRGKAAVTSLKAAGKYVAKDATAVVQGAKALTPAGKIAAQEAKTAAETAAKATALKTAEATRRTALAEVKKAQAALDSAPKSTKAKTALKTAQEKLTSAKESLTSLKTSTTETAKGVIETAAETGKKLSFKEAATAIMQKWPKDGEFTIVKTAGGIIVKPLKVGVNAIKNPSATGAVAAVGYSASEALGAVMSSMSKEEQWETMTGQGGLLDIAIEEGNPEVIEAFRKSIVPEGQDFNAFAGDNARETATLDFALRLKIKEANDKRNELGLPEYIPPSADAQVWTDDMIKQTGNDFGYKDPITGKFSIQAGSGNSDVQSFVNTGLDWMQSGKGTLDVLANPAGSFTNDPLGSTLALLNPVTNAADIVGGAVQGLWNIGSDVGSWINNNIFQTGTGDYFSRVKTMQTNQALLNGGTYSSTNKTADLGYTNYVEVLNPDGETYTIVNKSDYNRGFQEYLKSLPGADKQFNIYADNTSAEQQQKLSTLRNGYNTSELFKNASFQKRVVSTSGAAQQRDRDVLNQLGFSEADSWSNVYAEPGEGGTTIYRANKNFGRYKAGDPVYATGTEGMEQTDTVFESAYKGYQQAVGAGDDAYNAYKVSYELNPTATKSADELLTATERQSKAAYTLAMREYYHAWGMKPDEAKIAEDSTKLMSQGFTEEALKNWQLTNSQDLVAKTESLYPPAWKDYFDAGYTPQDKMAPFIQAAAEIYGVAPESIRIEDKIFKNVFSTDKDGNIKVMNVYDWSNAQKQTSGYAGTSADQANMGDLATGLASMIRM